MCGRFACNLGPDVLQCACSYYDAKSNRYKKPDWVAHPSSGPRPRGKGNESSEDSAAAYSSAESSAESAAQSSTESLPTGKFYPSVNIAPSKFTPVLIQDPENPGERILQPMKWGLIPVWHKGLAKAQRFSTINCRVEGMTRSRLWRHPLSHRRLCAVVAQGFYEWKAPKNKMPKQPYFVHMAQDAKFGPEDVANEDVWEQSPWNETQGWSGPKLVMMAGVYDIWHDADRNPVYSYSIVTTAADKCMTWLHPRMPAILETPEDLEAWLNPPEDATVEDIVNVLKPSLITALDWYLVSDKVNNPRCQDIDCIKPKRIEESLSCAVRARTEEKENKEEVEIATGMGMGEENPFDFKLGGEASGDVYGQDDKDGMEAEIKRSKIATP